VKTLKLFSETMVSEWAKVVLLLAAVASATAKATSPMRTTKLFDEPYKPEESRHFEIQKSSTFSPNVKKQFDLAYADGTELKGFNGNDIVHVSN
jgi:hypothetical protein